MSIKRLFRNIWDPPICSQICTDNQCILWCAVVNVLTERGSRFMLARFYTYE